MEIINYNVLYNQCRRTGIAIESCLSLMESGLGKNMNWELSEPGSITMLDSWDDKKRILDKTKFKLRLCLYFDMRQPNLLFSIIQNTLLSLVL